MLGALRASERGASRPPETALAPPPALDAASRYQALCEMHGRLHAASSGADVLAALADALRTAFGSPRGACSAGGAEVRWDEGGSVLVAGGASPDATLAGFATESMIALPMAHAGNALGKVWMALPARAVETAALLAEITGAIGAAAAVLDRVALTARAQSRSEALATALHRGEAARRTPEVAGRLEGLAQFAAGAAHEINNPLAVISGRAQLLLSQTPGAESARALDVIVQQSRRISRIVSDLMQFARPTGVGRKSRRRTSCGTSRPPCASGWSRSGFCSSSSAPRTCRRWKSTARSWSRP